MRYIVLIQINWFEVGCVLIYFVDYIIKIRSLSLSNWKFIYKLRCRQWIKGSRDFSNYILLSSDLGILQINFIIRVFLNQNREK